jgi:glycosyltransferase involved in cell wall biosynthesis
LPDNRPYSPGTVAQSKLLAPDANPSNLPHRGGHMPSVSIDAPSRGASGVDESCTIVIPSLGRFSLLQDCIDDLAAQSCPAAEVIIVLQGDISPSAVADLQSRSKSAVRVFYLDVPNASFARNIGLSVAVSSIVLFLDDDVRIPDREFLAKHLANFNDPNLAGVYGQVLEVGECPVYEPAPEVIESGSGWMLLPANYARRCRTRNGGSGNLAVRRVWATAVGGMDSWFERGARREETEFNLRYTKLYGPLVFDPTASLVHLSAAGGSRSWGRVIRTVPWHHIIGHWYFLLAACRDRTLGPTGLLLELRHIAVALLKNPGTGWDILALANNCARAAIGLAVAAYRIAWGPRRLDKIDEKLFRELKPAELRKLGPV